MSAIAQGRGRTGQGLAQWKCLVQAVRHYSIHLDTTMKRAPSPSWVLDGGDLVGWNLVRWYPPSSDHTPLLGHIPPCIHTLTI